MSDRRVLIVLFVVATGCETVPLEPAPPAAAGQPATTRSENISLMDQAVQIELNRNCFGIADGAQPPPAVSSSVR